jgi:mannose-6-phosphate isomerase-like protein (cupin superfamily)
MSNYKENRPWGSFEILKQIKVADGDSCVKIITIKPKCRVSYQLHKMRSEHWTFIQGEGIVILNDQEQKIKAGSRVLIPVGTKHRAINTHESLDLVFVEVSTGRFDENDVVRLEDDYGRS